MTAKLPASKIDNAIRDYANGDSDSVVCARYDIGRTTLFRYLKRNGIPTHDRRMPMPIAEIISLYAVGESENAIAAKYGISRNVIRRRLIESGVEIRGQTEANRLLQSSRTHEQRMAYIAAAHTAVRGKKRTIEDLSKRAIGKERMQSHASETERQFAQWLTDYGLSPVMQKAIGTYNIDIAVPPVAVEIFGGGWHAYGSHAARSSKRFNYILNNGWAAVAIWVSSKYCPLTVEAADYVVAFLEQVRGNPSLIGQYRVIRGDGKDVTIDGTNLDYLTVKPSFARG